MKEFMQITGAVIIDNDWMELTLVPLTLAKPKKIGLMELAGGGLDDIVNAMQGNKQHKTTIPMKMTTWGDMKLRIGSHVSVELLGDKTTGGI